MKLQKLDSFEAMAMQPAVCQPNILKLLSGFKNPGGQWEWYKL